VVSRGGRLESPAITGEVPEQRSPNSPSARTTRYWSEDSAEDIDSRHFRQPRHHRRAEGGLYRLKKEDFAHVAQRLNVALEGRLEDMSEYYTETENDPQLVDIWAELEATYNDRAGPSITEGENLLASLSFDNMQKEAHRRESSQDKKTTALTPRSSQSDYAKVAKQVREWSFRFDGAEKQFEWTISRTT